MEILFDSEMHFKVVRLWAEDFLSSKLLSFDYEYLLSLSKFEDPELSDARCLIKMVKKEVDEFNTKIKTKRKLLRNLRYKSHIKSSIFDGLPIPQKKIKQLIEENPDKSYYEICHMLSVEVI